MVDTETMSFKAAENQQNLGLRQGAGIQSAQNLASHRPEVLLTGNCGPKAFKALEAAGVQVVVGVQGSVKEAVQAYLDGKYQAAAGANVEGHWV
jgi:predicted Fe-Mo cluster-binding NifX family protein